MDTAPVTLTNLVTAGERLRMELLDALRRAGGPRERAAVTTEMVMFYGQAFANVVAICLRQAPEPPQAAHILHECLLGREAFRQWLVRDTALDPQDSLARLTEHWQAIRDLVLTKN